MKKLVKIIIFIILFFLGININVHAEEKLYCKYDVSESNCNVGTADLIIEYSSDNKVVNVTKEIHKQVNSGNANIEINFPDTLSEIKIRNSSNNKLVCPKLYYNYNYQVNSATRQVTCSFNILFADSTEINENTKLLTKVAEEIENETQPVDDDNTDKVAKTCAYNYNNNKVLGFSIYESKKVKDFLLYGDYINNTVNNFIGEYSECPTNLYMVCGYGFCAIHPNVQTYSIELVLAGSETDANGKDASYVTTYKSIKGTSTIIIRKDTSSAEVRAYFGTEYTVINDSTYKNIFYTNQSSSFPTYIITTTNNNNNNTLSFSSELPQNNSDISNVYILASRSSIISSLKLNQIKTTCEAIFGGGEGSFMGFLKNNVFKVIWIAIPIILLIFTTIDFAKVVFNDDKDGLNNAWKKFGKRVIAAVLIYLTPTILIFIVDVIGADDVNSCIKTVQNMNESS